MSEDLLRDGLAQTTLHPLGLRVAQAKRSRLILEDGSEIIDFISGIGASSFGHSHPDILRAIHDQVDKHLHVMVYGEMRQTAQDLAAHRLLELLPESLDAAYFVNSGAEAIDAAMKLVRRVTGRTKILAVTGGYHGNTFGALSVSSNVERKAPFAPLVGDIELIEWNDPTGLNAIDASVAGVIVETVQGDAGIEFLTPIGYKPCEISAPMQVRIWCSMKSSVVLAALVGRLLSNILALCPITCAWERPRRRDANGGTRVKQSNLQQFAHSLLGPHHHFRGHPVPCSASAAASALLKATDWQRWKRWARPSKRPCSNVNRFMTFAESDFTSRLNWRLRKL